MRGRVDESCKFQRINDMSGRGMNKFNYSFSRLMGGRGAELMQVSAGSWVGVEMNHANFSGFMSGRVDELMQVSLELIMSRCGAEWGTSV